MTYSPFPEFELKALAKEYADAAARFPEGTRFRELYASRDAMLRNAVVCHEALRERCLIAETENVQLKRRSDAA